MMQMALLMRAFSLLIHGVLHTSGSEENNSYQFQRALLSSLSHVTSLQLQQPPLCLLTATALEILWGQGLGGHPSWTEVHGGEGLGALCLLCS